MARLFLEFMEYIAVYSDEYALGRTKLSALMVSFHKV